MKLLCIVLFAFLGTVRAVNKCEPIHTAGNTKVTCSNNDCSTATEGTTAQYSCTGKQGEHFSGSLTCESKVWKSMLRLGNSSLCELKDATILNAMYPDTLNVSSNVVQYKEPLPKRIKHPDQDPNGNYEEYQKMAVEYINGYRQKHGAKPLTMRESFNEAAVKIAIAAATKIAPPPLPLSEFEKLIRHNIGNLETNLYIQRIPADNNAAAVKQAIQTWYHLGKAYWNKNKNILQNEPALTFARLIWKDNEVVGCGVSTISYASYVACVFYPGRKIDSTDILADFKANVSP